MTFRSTGHDECRYADELYVKIHTKEVAVHENICVSNAK